MDLAPPSSVLATVTCKPPSVPCSDSATSIGTLTCVFVVPVVTTLSRTSCVTTGTAKANASDAVPSLEVNVNAASSAVAMTVSNR